MIAQLGEAARTSVGFFWKAGWAFVLGYAVSAMIQAFVPRRRLTRLLGSAGPRSISLATLFGAISSSCSFAALATARSLVLKGAHFAAAIAFMFASTNLVIELGVLIVIFLGWPFLAAELLGGLMLIAVSAVIVRVTAPRSWFEQARRRVERQGGEEEDDFDWRRRLRSREGWQRVGHRFVGDWRMVWEEIVIGFTVAGLMATLVPARLWEVLFLAGGAGSLPPALVAAENAVIAPLVAAATFIGSMGNIPLATVLHANGVHFAGLMGFIYSDLMVPPLVIINARYYGGRVALYIAAVMFVSIVVTALALAALFGSMGWTPHGGRTLGDITRFALDYTFGLNLAFAGVAVALVALHRSGRRPAGAPGRLTVKRGIALACAAFVLAGLVANLAGVGGG